MTVPAPGAHGGDGAAVARALGVDPAHLLDLSQSLNPGAPAVPNLVVSLLDRVGRYPDDEPATAALATAMGRPADELLITNGGSAAIGLLAAELGSGWVDPPDFSVLAEAQVELRGDGPRWRSDPHSPSGRLATGAEQDGVDVWDEAFYPLATGRWTRPGRPLVVGSLTKLWACPGLRLGYVAATDTDLIGRLRRRQVPWAVGGLALGAVEALVGMTDLAAWSARVAELRDDLVAVLGRHELVAAPSDANWVLVPGPMRFRDDLARLGVLVRDCTSFGLPGTYRIAVPDEMGLSRLVEVLEQWEARRQR